MELNKRHISEEQRRLNEIRYRDLYEQLFLNEIKTANPRIYKVLTESNHGLKPMKEPFHSVYIYGSVGSGKSVKAAWLMMEWIRLRFLHSMMVRNAVFTTCGDLLQELRNSYNTGSKTTEAEIVQLYKQIDILVLDDIGVMNTTDWTFNALYTIINYRYSHFKSTIYTSNLSLEQLSDLLHDDRISDRISHDCMGHVYHFTKQSRRNKDI